MAEDNWKRTVRLRNPLRLWQMADTNICYTPPRQHQMPSLRNNRDQRELPPMVTLMQRFYFDVYTLDGPETDTEGQLFETPERARTEALRILHDVAHDEMPDLDVAKITVKIRIDGDRQIFEASLTRTSDWSG